MINNRFSYVRAVSCIAIIILHMAYSSVLSFKNTASIDQLIIMNSISNLMMWAVPCFVMVTGSLLLDTEKNISYSKLFKKYIFRIVILIVIFSMMYRIFDSYTAHGNLNLLDDIMIGLKKAITGTGWSHLWYMYMVVSIYLILPVYKRFVANADTKDLYYFCGTILVFLSIVPILKLWDIQIGFYIQTTTIYSLYIVVGYMIYFNYMRMGKVLSLFVLLISSVLIVVFTILKYRYDIKYDLFNNYFSIVVICQSISIFNIFMNYNIKINKLIRKILISIDKCSLGIYMIHMFFIRYIFKNTDFNPFVSVINTVVIIVFVALSSYIITMILRRIPLIKKII